MVSRNRSTLFSLSFFTIGLLSAGDAGAESFLSEAFGFRFSVPDGFVEGVDEEPATLADGTPMTVAAFVEEDQTSEIPISIFIERLGQTVDPNQRADLSSLPQEEGVSLSLEIKRWKDSVLQVLKHEASFGPGLEAVGYLIQFPLKDEAIQLRVQGPQDRRDEVLSVFDASVKGFLNTKPYIVTVEPAAAPASGSQDLMPLWWMLAALAAGAVFILGTGLVRKTSSKRPMGVLLVALLGLCGSSWTAGNQLIPLSAVFADAEGSVSLSNAFAANMAGELFLSLAGGLAFVGLTLGQTWGWWASTFYWTWRVCSQVFLANPGATWLAVITGAFLLGLLLAYHYKNRVLTHYRLNGLSKRNLLLGSILPACIFSGVWRLLVTALME